MSEVRLALDAFYPGRLAAFFAFENQELRTTAFCETLERQSGMYRIAAQIEEGFRSVHSADYSIELDRRRAIEEIIRMAHDGDTVLLAGKGHETYQEFEDTVVPFDDRVHAQEALEMLGVSLTN